MTADVWFLRWIVRQFTRKSLRFWRWQRKTTNADTKPPIFATDGPPATNTDSNNKAPRMGSEVALLSPVHLKDPSNPNLDNTQRNSGQEAGYMHGPYDSWQTLAARSLNCADGGIGSVAALQLEIRCQNSHCTDNCTGCDGRNYPCIASDLV
jgi:hypothetical protein